MMNLLPWPLDVTPLTALPTIPEDPRLPAAYFELVATGQWPEHNFYPTKEPTSDSLTGAYIHAFALPGPKLASPLPAHLWPFAHDGAQYWCFDLATPGPAIRYLDWDVDQWLTVAPDFNHFIAQLTWQSPALSPTPSPQAFAHAALIADAQALPSLLEYARTALPSAQYGEWLSYWLQQPELRPLAVAELTFARQYRWSAFSPRRQQRLASLAKPGEI